MGSIDSNVLDASVGNSKIGEINQSNNFTHQLIHNQSSRNPSYSIQSVNPPAFFQSSMHASHRRLEKNLNHQQQQQQHHHYNQPQIVSQSVNSNLRMLDIAPQGQSLTASQNFSIPNLQQLPQTSMNRPQQSQQPQILANVITRGESNSNIKQVIMHKERNCKTSSPKHHFTTHESRLRKKSREMVIKKRESFAELIVVLGLKYNEFVESKRIVPQVVDSHPDLSIKEVAKEHNYVDNLMWICFPEGYSFQSYEKRKEGELCQMNTFHFIITNQDGLKKYITSILFKELFLSEKLGAFIVPKSLCVISSKPTFSLQKQLLTLIFQKVILPYNSASIQAWQAQFQNPSSFIWYLNDMNEELIKKNPDLYLQQRIEFYLTVFFNHMYYSEEVENDIEIEEIVERVIPAGYEADGSKRNRVKRRIAETFFRYRNTKSYGFTLENYSFELLLQSLKPEKIIFLITALLLERKIILIKDNFGDIAVIMESLVSLLNPLKWNFIFITYLTPKLVECLEAPFPYIIGVSRKIWENQCLMREFPEDIIIFDIDNQEKLSQVRQELPPLPQPQANVLERSLKELLDIKERFIEILHTNNTTQKLSKEKIDEYYWAYAQLRVKQSFFNFFMLTINNYIGYFKNLDEDGDLSPNKKDKKFYDKLSSIDVFDFDNYLNQFQGQNKDFMEKFVRTQSFNNFIEETYKNISPKTPIGFFKTNFEVMLEHSFKRLKKEQNKLIDHTLFNLYNPVKFNIGHMFKHYKKQLLQKHGEKLKKILEEEGDLNSTDNNDEIRDPYQRQDLFEKLLLQEVEGNSKKQLSILNNINQDLITEMPGIQYEQIGIYEQLRSQRSDQSQDRRKHNKTTINGPNTVHFEFQQRVQNEQTQLTDMKSRNNNNIIQSRSGDTLRNMINQSVLLQPKGGLIYKNYLSMADNQNQSKLQDEDTVGLNSNTTALNQTNNGLLTQELEMKLIGSLTSKNHQMNRGHVKNRINSENSMIKNLGSFSMNKTVVVNANQHLQHQRPATVVQNQQVQKSKTKVYENINTLKSSLNQSENFAKGLASTLALKSVVKDRCTSSPRIINKKSHNLSQSTFILDSSNKKVDPKQQQQTVLKEALNRKIMHERQRHGLHLRSEDRMTNQIPKAQMTLLSPYNQRGKVGVQTTTNKVVGESNTSNVIKQSFPQRGNIDLMNPKKQKISRNEERKLAKKRGFLGFEQHDSFYQFYSPKEELSKLAKMQMAQKLKNERKLSMMDSKDNSSFSNFLAQNYNSNGSDEEQLQKAMLLQQQQYQNKIVFQKRSPTSEQYVLIANDPLSTNINFQSNFIQQKPFQQSPSINEMSSIKKQDRNPKNNLQDSIDDDFCIVEKYSPALDINQFSSSQMLSNVSPVHPKIIQNNYQLKVNQLSDSKDIINEIEKVISLGHKKIQSSSNVEEIESLETRPLKFDEQMNGQPNIQMKHPKIRASESPQVLTSQSNNLSFKHFINNVKDRGLKQVNNGRQNNKQVSQTNKSPTINSSKYQTNSKQISTKDANKLQTQTFDSNTTRNDLNKPSVSSSILQRKRSSPTIADKISGAQTQTNKQAANKPTSKQPLQKSAYFKQRPVAHHSKSNKSSSNIAAGSMNQMPIVQIDLERKEKLKEKPDSRLAIEKEMQSLRISPIPNLNMIINQQTSTEYGENHQYQNSINKDTTIKTTKNQSSASLLNHQSNKIRETLKQNSRKSEKSIQNGGDHMFQSMSHLIESDIFEKAQLTIVGPMTQRHSSHQNDQNFQSAKLQYKFNSKYQIKTSSERNSSSLNHNHEVRSRVSNLSIQSLHRPSNLSLMADLNRQEKELELINSERQSDILSSQEAPNNFSISMIKSSPRMINKAVSNIAKGYSQLSSLQGNKNFTLQEGTSVPPSVLTSQDTTNMKTLLNALKQQLPNKQENIGTVKIDLNRNKKVVFSPKGLGEENLMSKKNMIENVDNSQEISKLPTGKIKQMNSDPRQSIHAQVSDKERVLGSNKKNKKDAKSPQPSSQVLPSNTYLKSLQSQEFQLKEKTRKKYNQVYNTLHQSIEPISGLQKEPKSLINNQLRATLIATTKSHIASQKLLYIETHDPTLTRIEQNFQSNDSKRGKSGCQRQLNHNSQSCKSIQNLYQAISKEKLMQEINGVNEALNRIEMTKKITKSKNFFEEALLSKSNSIRSYKTSPKAGSASLIRPVQKPNQNEQKAHKNSSIFKTISSNIMDINEYATSTVQQQAVIATVRNVELPIKKINFNPQQLLQNVKSISQGQPQRQPLQESENQLTELVIIDFPRQIEENFDKREPYSNTNSIINNERSNKSRVSLFNRSEDSNPTNSIGFKFGQRGNQGNQTQKHSNVSSKVKDNYYTQHNEHNRGRSQKSQFELHGNQPLVEIRYTSNENKPLQQQQLSESQKALEVSLKGIKKGHQNHHHHHHVQNNRNAVGLSHLTNPSLAGSNNVASSRHSHAIHSEKIPHELNNILMKQQKKRQLRHGLTTCFAAPSKDSIQYIKRDINHDAFCKINSHLGDIDNDPHTPKSSGSLRSIEKNKRKRRDDYNQLISEQNQATLKLRLMEQQIIGPSHKHTPLRLHSASLDDCDFASPPLLEDAPHQTKRRKDHEEDDFLQAQQPQNQDDFVNLREKNSSASEQNNQEELQEDEFDQQNEAYNEMEDYQPNHQQQEQNIKLRQNTHNSTRLEVLFDDADLKDTDDKFTSRDINFHRLRHFMNE